MANYSCRNGEGRPTKKQEQRLVAWVNRQRDWRVGVKGRPNNLTHLNRVFCKPKEKGVAESV